MSSIVQLTIQGIRSFGIKAEDKQSITFASPVTLILGANGCGKTTIIECLKYALTGELPPGSDHGKSFVHDPKIFDCIECLGQVKLKVKNIRGEYLTVTRSVKVFQKRGKLAFASLDANVTFGEDECESISKRVLNVDTEMTQFMGVSKAIMNNVIFCHQEDSSWPLDEAKKLKEKFDAIFGTTEYNKAIDKIIKMRKEQLDQQKTKAADLKYAQHMKEEADVKNLDLEKQKNKNQSLKDECTKFDEELKPIEERLSSIYKIELEVSKFHAEKIKLQTELKNCRDNISSLQSKIKNIFEGNVPQLDREIRNFHEKMEEKNSELQSLEEQLKLIKNQERKIQSNLTDLDRKRTKLIHQRQQEQESIGERAKKVTELCKNLNILLSSSFEEANEKEVDRILNKIKDSLKDEEKKISDLSSKHDKLDQQKQSEIDNCRETKTSIESDIQSKKSQKLQQEKELNKIENEITNTEINANKLADITKTVEELDKKINIYTEKVNFDSKKKEIELKRCNIKKKHEEFVKLDERLTFLNSISKITSEIQLKENDLVKREQEVRRIKNKNSENLKNIFSNRTVESNFKRHCQDVYEDMQRKLKELNEQININRLKQKELEIKRKHQKDEISKSETELEKAKDKIFDKCQNLEYDELLARSKENIQKYQLDLGALKSSESMYKKYMKKIEEDPCCPLCHKILSTNDATDLTSEMSDEIRRVPDNIKKSEKLLKSEQIKYEGLLSLKPVIETTQRLETDIPKAKLNLKQIEEELPKAKNEVESCLMLTAEPNANLDLVNSMLGDMSLLDEALKEVSRIQVDLNKLKKTLPEGAEASNIDDVQLEKSTVFAELENEREDAARLQTDYESEFNMFNRLREKRTALKDSQIKLQEGIQSLPQLKTQQTETSKKIQNFIDNIKQLEKDLEPLKTKLSVLNEEKLKLKNQNRNIINEMNSKLDLSKKIDHDIQRTNKELQNLAELNLEQAIEDLKKSLKRVTDDQTTKNEENKKITKNIEDIKNEISNQELFERDLKDNRELKLLQQREQTLNAEHEDLTKGIGELDYQNVSKEKNELTKKRDRITVKKGEILGQTGEINNQIKKLEKELNDTKYKDAIKNYRTHFYEVEILKRIVADLKRYQSALEWALNIFHSEKMKKINQLIRELWRQIYKGNDIDYIQIKTEADENKVVNTDKRRNYNYSVVQSKNHSQIEMRGRCSAGQRVLASLIIRMALAETFSSNCGVLALDEPTTNLDRKNIGSLCEALNRIVEERQSQSNFMLIIITHDEEFISTLGKIRSYHKVQRDSDGKSQIRKVKIA